eukprot:197907-Amphidinium_carterae.1
MSSHFNARMNTASMTHFRHDLLFTTLHSRDAWRASHTPVGREHSMGTKIDAETKSEVAPLRFSRRCGTALSLCNT